MDHMELIERATTAIQQVHSDMSVSQQDTLYSLKGLREEINIMIDAIESDLRIQEMGEMPF